MNRSCFAFRTALSFCGAGEKLIGEPATLRTDLWLLRATPSITGGIQLERQQGHVVRRIVGLIAR